MSYDPLRHHRHSIRLPGYDYAQCGAYHVTIVTQGRACLFGEVVVGVMRLTEAGEMVQRAWDELPTHYASVAIDAFQVMPNHIHGIIVLVGAASCGRPIADGGATTGDGATTGGCPYQPMSLGDVVHRFKSWTTRIYADAVYAGRWPAFVGHLWQRNYYEHILRSNDELDRARAYIAANPAQWANDRERDV